MDFLHTKSIISHISSAENNSCQSEEASELGHNGLLCNQLSSQKYICVTHSRTHYFHWQMATET